jgi:hypothetical protein
MNEIITKLIEALRAVNSCCDPVRVSLYDEEGIEGWRWTAGDGREWTEMGDWDDEPIHPLAEEAIELAEKFLKELG